MPAHTGKLPVRDLFHRLLPNYAGTVRHGLIAGMRSVDAIGFAQRARELTAEERFLAHLQLGGKKVYDVGAHVGVFTMFFARQVGVAGSVYSFEPVPGNFFKLKKNVDINRLTNVHAFNMAVGNRTGYEQMSMWDDSSGTFYIENSELLRSCPSSEVQKRGACIDVPIDSLDHFVTERCIPGPDFVKIDVEGFEFEVLMGMQGIIASCRPALFIEMHGINAAQKLANTNRVLEVLRARAYSVIHVESNTRVPASNGTGLSGHLYATPEIS